ncbi:AAC(3) family N-acetyltransferase [Chitinophaga filiformis]|uniref:AAC(3) family N-acetyltransferase n=1 Tax=Chitinophaga filiformis TaxID=104663 RepID=UPI001F47A996|nr:AAC(3) family N-acetyltransferase [Chitinophaga filiformis]MCF6401904.1 AAC(3) family N-acetyltransferase [Chitinophaga filiformis]
METNIEKNVRTLIGQKAPGSVLIHSDLMQGFAVEFTRGGKEKFIADHNDKLSLLFGNISIYQPTFNYKFLPEKKTDVRNRRSEVGVLSEYFRKNVADWYTKDPVFSFSGKGPYTYNEPVKASGPEIDPFGDTSFFNYLYDQDTLLFHYGSEFKHSTVLHYIERKLGTVPYRYDKIFEGIVVDGDEEISVRYKYHVRPWGKHLDYDWDKIIADLVNENILYKQEENNTRICFCSVREMTDFLFTKISGDPLYLLDKETLQWVAPSLDKLGRAFTKSDFE